ncbi:enhancer of split M1 protein [Anastrepha ludens]|uniref:enhancer of split M1 protein n=1 Tax=Anastrepha ludens TaxID=28586 RepID=UPI0023B1464E|nr:enhancer of split M1 protein [Anastrepha ludens]
MLYNKNFIIFVALFAYCSAHSVNTLTDLQIEEEDSEQPCPLVCPAMYAPTCGFDGADYQEFVNPCMLNLANCERQKTRSLKKPFAQTDIDWCATKLVDLYDWLSKMDVDLNKSECLKPCPMIYAPVCISNGKYRATIPTACLLDQFNCALNGTKLSSDLFRVLSSYKCEQS